MWSHKNLQLNANYTMFPKNSHVEILTASTSQCDCYCSDVCLPNLIVKFGIQCWKWDLMGGVRVMGTGLS